MVDIGDIVLYDGDDFSNNTITIITSAPRNTCDREKYAYGECDVNIYIPGRSYIDLEWVKSHAEKDVYD